MNAVGRLPREDAVSLGIVERAVSVPDRLIAFVVRAARSFVEEGREVLRSEIRSGDFVEHDIVRRYALVIAQVEFRASPIASVDAFGEAVAHRDAVAKPPRAVIEQVFVADLQHSRIAFASHLPRTVKLHDDLFTLGTVEREFDAVERIDEKIVDKEFASRSEIDGAVVRVGDERRQEEDE